MSKIGHEATNHLPSLVIRMGRGICVLIVVRRVFLAYMDFTFISQCDFGNRKRRTTIANSGWGCLVEVGLWAAFLAVSKSCFYLFINGLKLIFVLMKYELFVLKLMVNLDFWRNVVGGSMVFGVICWFGVVFGVFRMENIVVSSGFLRVWAC